MRAPLLYFAAAFMILLQPSLGSELDAQTVSGRVSDQTAGQPLAGALVTLVDSAGGERVTTLTNAGGSYVLRAPRPGPYTIRAEHIGYETATRSVRLRARATASVDLALGIHPVALEGLEVVTERRCRVPEEMSRELARVWEEVRKALRANAWTQREARLRYRVRRWSRELDPRTGTVLTERADTAWRMADRPFTTPPPVELIEQGFVRIEANRSDWYAPDVEVILSEAFLATHCFRLAGPDDAEGGDGARVLIALEFEPASGAPARGVRGRLWLDARTSKLEHLEYSYTGLPEIVGGEEFGGRLDFRRLDSGGWIIDRWLIRGPALEALRRAPDRWERSYRLSGIAEEGGEVLEVIEPVGGARRASATESGVLTGTVYDGQSGGESDPASSSR